MPIDAAHNDTMDFCSLDDVPLAGRTILVRVDFNLPMYHGAITDDTRMMSSLPTIRLLTGRGAKVVLIAHFGRPNGQRDPQMSLRPLVGPLSQALGFPVAWGADCIGPLARAAITRLKMGEVVLLENLRFHRGEEDNTPEFAHDLADGMDIFVNDAFSVSHRAHASTEYLTRLLPSYPGLSMQREITALSRALKAPKRPVMGIVGGAKISTKFDLLKNLVTQLDVLAVGGGMANTFLHAQGHNIGRSLCEHDMAPKAQEIIALAASSGCQILLPVDIVVAEKAAAGASNRICALAKIEGDDMILDAGPLTIARLTQAMDTARTLVWNGPLGVFELAPFDRGTFAAARHAASLVDAGRLIAVGGGGDTVAALNQAGVGGSFSFLSTAGGAFLEWMEGKDLPGVSALTQIGRANSYQLAAI